MSISDLLDKNNPVTKLTRNTAADGDNLQATTFNELANRDIALADYIQELSGNAYHHDTGTNKIYHYQDNDVTKSKVYDINVDNVTATNVTAANVTATNVTATNVTATNVTATNVTATNVTATNVTANNNVNLLSASNTPVTAATAIFADLLAKNAATNTYIEENESRWVGISAISATGMTEAYTGPLFSILPGDNVTITKINDNTIKLAATSTEKAYVNGTTLYIGSN